MFGEQLVNQWQKATLISLSNTLKRRCPGAVSAIMALVHYTSLKAWWNQRNTLIYWRVQRCPRCQSFFLMDLGYSSTILHRATRRRSSRRFCKKNLFRSWRWPGNSPDLNPIENLKSNIIKQKLRGRDCTTKEKLIEAVIHVWHHDQGVIRYYQSLVDSMPNQVRNVIKNRGAHKIYWKDVCSLNN